MGTFNCGAFVAGIVRVSATLNLYMPTDLLMDESPKDLIPFSVLKGVLDSAGFPAVVTAHFVPMEGQQRPRTTILIKFAEEVNIALLFFCIHCSHLIRAAFLPQTKRKEKKNKFNIFFSVV